jgi:predicted HTH transcriptional regulator
VVADPLVEFITHGREERNLEYKASLDWADEDAKAKLTKSALAMANIRDGGAVVLGVRKHGEQYTPEGMHPEHAHSFTQDGVAAHVSEFADPFVELTISHVPYDGKNFVVIQVEEFAELPVICRKDGRENLRRGAVYTRSRRMHETAEVRSQAEMREILDMAVEKGIRAFYERAERARLAVVSVQPDGALFDEQLGEL